MFRVNDIKIPVDGSQELKPRIAEKLRLPEEEIKQIVVRRRSLDARRRSEIHFVYTADVALKDRSSEKTLLRRHGRALGLSKASDAHYVFPYEAPSCLADSEDLRPVVVGSGPAGLFCALELARAGFAPIVLERGAPVDERADDVDRFWESGDLKSESNVCFGEGGAGAFSDGKLTSSSNDGRGLNAHVLETFVRFGADEDILSWYRPHVGTDRLRPLMKAVRGEIIARGGEVRFHTRCEKFITTADAVSGRQRLSSVLTYDTLSGRQETIRCAAAVLACGHSAHDTFAALESGGLDMRAKPFAVGLRVQHKQSMIDRAQYGDLAAYLGPADYRLTSRTASGRGVYTFCMCPGGYVVNSSSEAGFLTVNGMSYHDRSGANANAAVVVTVGLKDLGSDAVLADDPLSGIRFQQQLERKAWRLADGAIPVQRYGDLLRGGAHHPAPGQRTGSAFPQDSPDPAFKGAYSFTDLRGLLPPEVEQAFIEGMTDFGRKIPGFDDAGTLLAGIESRTSSAVRIPRDERGESSIAGLFPCGEGPGWAGGIMSSACDGITQAEHAAAMLASLAAGDVD